MMATDMAKQSRRFVIVRSRANGVVHRIERFPTRRAVQVSAIDLGIPCSVSVATDDKFDNGLVCILSISRENWVSLRH